MNLKALGVLWYTAETYGKVKELSSDKDNFFDTFDEWVADAERKLGAEKYRGLRIVRIDCDPAELAAFCRMNNTDVNGRSRASFASLKVADLSHKSSQ